MLEQREGEALLLHQENRLHKLNQMLVSIMQYNRFYKEKLKDITLPLKSLEEIRQLPFTEKKELVEDQNAHPPYGSNHTFPIDKYVRYHQTSGTSGTPLKVLDTKESWEWWEDCWAEVYRASGVTEKDTVFLAFSFGPFIGFWAAFEAAKKIGALVIASGSQKSNERLYSMIENKATVLLCTPSYALHLAEMAEQHQMDLKNTSVRTIITAGEPGGSVPSIRERIEALWGAKLFDHVGMTEMGAYGYSCSEQKGIHVNEEQFIAEVIDPDTLEWVGEGERGELVLTNLGRLGYPAIRYRTGDIVFNSSLPCKCGNHYQFFPGGIAGRKDDMVVIRGINIYPSSIEAVIREFPEITEFRIVYYTVDYMDQVKVKFEANRDISSALAWELRDRIGLRIDVEKVKNGTLERFTMKARRIIDERKR
ncbi:phenylacetate--CoA ligase family protein [Heyndrickxia coagulans]|uniref:phenylacetate--CoA ligase family protein n=1 Tax=Heyndrickxia coagulans TaxID=1398 RepID=UPI0015C60106|nr:AMP-binding protein [Heyndrickxia coagulans]